MPLGDLESLLDAANRLEAKERLARIADYQVASGTLKRGAAQQHVRRLKRFQRMGRRARPATKADLAMMGIQVSNG